MIAILDVRERTHWSEHLSRGAVIFEYHLLQACGVTVDLGSQGSLTIS